MTSSYPIPDVLPILVLPANNILYPSLVLSLQLARPDSLALLQALLRVSSTPTPRRLPSDLADQLSLSVRSGC